VALIFLIFVVQSPIWIIFFTENQLHKYYIQLGAYIHVTVQYPYRCLLLVGTELLLIIYDNVNFFIRNDHGMELPEEGSYATGLIFMDEASEEKTR
jgi:hypothetical protein